MTLFVILAGSAPMVFSVKSVKFEYIPVKFHQVTVFCVGH